MSFPTAMVDSDLTNAVINENLETVERLITTFPTHPVCLGAPEKVSGSPSSAGDSRNPSRGVWTLLHSASWRKDVDVVELLLTYGADANAKDSKGRTPIFYAIESVDVEIARLLLVHGADISNCRELLHSAVKVESRDLVEILLEHNADVNATDRHGKTPLHHIAMSHDPVCNIYHQVKRINAKSGCVANKVAITELLLRAGALINARTRDGLTAVHIAAQSCSREVLETLIAHGADVNCQSDSGITPLHCAADRGNNEVAEILLTQGADPNSRQKDEATALHLAAESGFDKMVEVLAEYGADINATDKYGRTALHLAAINARLAVAVTLLDYSADVNVTCEDNCTALNYANLPEIFANLYPAELTGAIIGRLRDSFNLWNYNQIAEALRKQIIKMHVLGAVVSDENLKAVNMDYTYEVFYYRCVSEVAKMKDAVIGDSFVTFHDILMKSPDTLTLFAGNEIVERVLLSKEYETKFPHYSVMIANNFKIAQMRKRLYDSSVKVLNFVVGYPLPYIVGKEILNLVSDTDLRNLIRAFNQGKGMQRE